MKNQFICKECQKKFYTKIGLGNHISFYHGIKIYYDKYFKKEGEGFCQICYGNTKFISVSKGYSKSCCKDHEDIIKGKNLMKKIKKEYNVNSPMQINELKNKQRNSCFINNGVNSMLEIEKIRKKGLKKSKSKKSKKKRIETCLKKYGVENPYQNKEIKENIKEINLKNLGVEYPLQNKEIQGKFIKTCFEKYGVKFPLQNAEIFIKQQKSGFKLNLFKDTSVYYRGTYELDFLEKYYNIFTDLRNGPLIKYSFLNKNRIYHPDFYIPSLNLIIEIKGSYYFKLEEDKIKSKEKAVIHQGFKYIIIIDKNYEILDSFLLCIRKKSLLS